MDTTQNLLAGFPQFLTDRFSMIILWCVYLNMPRIMINVKATMDFTYQRLLYARKLYKNEVVKNKKSYEDFINILEEYFNNFFVDKTLVINEVDVNRKKVVLKNLIFFMRAEQAVIEKFFQARSFRYLTGSRLFDKEYSAIMKLKEAADIEKKRNVLVRMFAIEDAVSINELIEGMRKYIVDEKPIGVRIAAMIKVLTEYQYLKESDSYGPLCDSIRDYYQVYIGTDESIIRYFRPGLPVVTEAKLKTARPFFKLNTQSNNETAKTNN